MLIIEEDVKIKVSMGVKSTTVIFRATRPFFPPPPILVLIYWKKIFINQNQFIFFPITKTGKM